MSLDCAFMVPSVYLFIFIFLLLYSLRRKYIMHFTLQSFSGMKLADTTNMNYCVFIVAPLCASRV